MPTTFRYTGQCWEVGPGLYFYRARWYDPALGRFIQADTIVPPESKRVAVTPLQVGAFEPEYIAQVAQENREVAAYGYSFQRDARTLSRTKAHFGPLEPQLLNRYSYVSNNPLHYVDLTGHFKLSSQQLQLLYAFVKGVMDDWGVAGLAAALDMPIVGIGGAIIAEVGLAIDVVNEMSPFLPGAKLREGYRALYAVLLQAITACQWAGESPVIDMLVFFQKGYWLVYITVCGNGQCHSYMSDPVSASAMEGMLAGPTGYGFLDALLDLGVNWEYWDEESKTMYSGWEWWYNRRAYNPDPALGNW